MELVLPQMPHAPTALNDLGRFSLMSASLGLVCTQDN